MSAQPAPIEVFYSCANADEDLCCELDKHLRQLRHDGLITTWHTRQIIAGTDWTKALDRHLNKASVILLLISSDFVASDYCYGVEMQRAMERHEAGETHVIPVLLRPVDWQSAPFGKLQALPRNGVPITKWRDRDAAFADVVQDIRAALQEFQCLAVSTPLTSFPRIWNIPYPHNPVFTGREEILSQIERQLQVGEITAISQAQALSGLGGIGKTQVAIEYAYQHVRDYQAVFWTLADTRESLISGYITIAGLLNVPEKDEQDQTIVVNTVVRWLTTHTGWLLILDNADDLTVVREFVPSVFGGHILLTTRAQAMGRLAHRIEIDTMPTDVGALFLLRRALLLAPDAPLEDAATIDIAIASEICEELGGLPLALDQAGAYVEEVQCSLQDYQHRYRTHRTHLLQRRGGLVLDHPEPVAATWALSFEKVQQQNPSAADLLRLCAFLYPDAIPVELITKEAIHLGPSLASMAEDPFLLDEALAVLGNYSLIRRNGRNNTLSIHRLVQAVLRDEMSAESAKQWMVWTISVVNAAFPSAVTFGHWPLCERYLPHALHCIQWIEQVQIDTQEARHLLHEVGYYLTERGRYREAEFLYQRGLASLSPEVETRDLHGAYFLTNLGYLYIRQGRYTEAEPLLRHALTLQEGILGVEHSATANTLENLASLYKKQGRYSDAEPLYQRVLALREKLYGPHHPSTAISLNNLALLYMEQEQDTKAEPLLQRALSLFEQQPEPDQPSTAGCLENLGQLYMRQGKDEQAEMLLQRALALSERSLGPKHIDTATCLYNLGQLFMRQGKYDQAEALHVQALSIHEQRLGHNHPDTAYLLRGLAYLSYHEGKLEQAELLYLQSLIIREQHLGPTHPDTLETRQAYSDFLHLLSMEGRQLGTEYPHTAGCLSNLAGIYWKQERYAEAEPLLVRALTLFEQQAGPQHHDTAGCLYNLGLLSLKQGKYEQSEAFYQQALSIRERCLGPTHPHTADVLHGLAELYQCQEKYEQAENMYRRALAIREQCLGLTHPDTQETRKTYAAFLRVIGRDTEEG